MNKKIFVIGLALSGIFASQPSYAVCTGCPDSVVSFQQNTTTAIRQTTQTAQTFRNTGGCNTGCYSYRQSCLMGNRIKNYSERYVAPYGVPSSPIKLPHNLCNSKDCLAQKGFHRLVGLMKCQEVVCEERCKVYQAKNVVARTLTKTGCQCLNFDCE